MESLNPIDGLDEPLRPLNMVEESDASSPSSTTQVPSADPDDDPDDASDDRDTE